MKHKRTIETCFLCNHVATSTREFIGWSIAWSPGANTRQPVCGRHAERSSTKEELARWEDDLEFLRREDTRCPNCREINCSGNCAFEDRYGEGGAL